MDVAQWTRGRQSGREIHNKDVTTRSTAPYNAALYYGV